MSVNSIKASVHNLNSMFLMLGHAPNCLLSLLPRSNQRRKSQHCLFERIARQERRDNSAPARKSIDEARSA